MEATLLRHLRRAVTVCSAVTVCMSCICAHCEATDSGKCLRSISTRELCVYAYANMHKPRSCNEHISPVNSPPTVHALLIVHFCDSIGVL